MSSSIVPLQVTLAWQNGGGVLYDNGCLYILPLPSTETFHSQATFSITHDGIVILEYVAIRYTVGTDSNYISAANNKEQTVTILDPNNHQKSFFFNRPLFESQILL